MLTLLGLAVGFIIGATGIGAGSLMTPALILLVHMPAAEAVGTSLAYASVAKCVSAASHVWYRSVDWATVGWLALGSLSGTVAAVVLEHAWWQREDDGLLLVVVGGLLAASGLVGVVQGPAAVLRQRRTAPVAAAAEGAQRQAPAASTLSDAPRAAPVVATAKGGAQAASVNRPGLLAVGGVVIGLATTLTSVGVGVLTAPLLVFATRFGPRRSVATNITHGFLLTTAAAAAYMSTGHVPLPTVGTILLGAIPGILLGGAVSRRVRRAPFSAMVSAAAMLSGVVVLLQASR